MNRVTQEYSIFPLSKEYKIFLWYEWKFARKCSALLEKFFSWMEKSGLLFYRKSRIVFRQNVELAVDWKWQIWIKTQPSEMTVEKIQRHSFSPEELLCCVSYEFCNFGYCFYSTGFPFFQNRGSLNNNLREVFFISNDFTKMPRKEYKKVKAATFLFRKANTFIIWWFKYLESTYIGKL